MTQFLPTSRNASRLSKRIRATSVAWFTVVIIFGFAAAASGDNLLLNDRQQIIMLGDSLTEGEDPDGYVNTTRLVLAQLFPDRIYFIANAGKDVNFGWSRRSPERTPRHGHYTRPRYRPPQHT